jgi:hypothetical protein
MEFFEVVGSSKIENIPFEIMAPRLLDSWSNPSCMSG